MSQSKRINIPHRFREIGDYVYQYSTIHCFLEKYYSDDKGWRFYEDKYIDQVSEDFPVGIARKKFDTLIKIIKSNFPIQEEQAYILRLFEPRLLNFGERDEQFAKDFIESGRKFNSREEMYIRRLDIIYKVRDTYRTAFKEHYYEISGQKKEDEKEDEYYEYWIACTVTYADWFKYRNIDFWSYIDHCELEEYYVENIIDHQYRLFFQAVKDSVENKLSIHNSLVHLDWTIQVLELNLLSIENFFHKGFDTEANEQKLNTLFGYNFSDSKSLFPYFVKAVDKSFDIKTDCHICEKGSFKNHPFFVISVVLEYERQAKDLLSKVKQIQKKNTTPINKKNHTPSFGIKKPKNTEWLLDLLTQLNFAIDLLKDSTTPKDMYDILTASNYTEFDKEIHLACETKQFAYIIPKLKGAFSRLSFAEIERSNKFFSSDSNLIKADNLSNSKSDFPKQKEEIDAVFMQFIKYF